MKNHSDKGRLLISQAILLEPNKWSLELRAKALACVLAYKDNKK